MKSAVAYLRVSRQTQETERQEDVLLQYANENGIEIRPEGIFKEKITGVSIASERPEFSKMLEYLNNTGIKLVLTTEVSRLGRNKVELTKTLEYFIENKIDVVFKSHSAIHLLNDYGERDWIATLILDLLSTFSQMERETAITRNKEGMQHAISKMGSGYGGVKPYGFERIEVEINGKTVPKLQVNEYESNIVREIFNKYLEGLGTKQLANWLNNQNIKTRYNTAYDAEKLIKTRKGLVKPVKAIKWTDGVLYGILKNRIYVGERRLNEYEFIETKQNKGKHNKKERRLLNTFIYEVPQIVETEIFEKVQKLLNDNYTKKGNNIKYENILKDKIKCGICGHNYFMHKRFSGRDNAYKCTSIRYNNNCGNYGIGIDRLNNAVYFYLKAYVKFNNTENIEYLEKLKMIQKNLLITKENIIQKLEHQDKSFKNILTLNLAEDNFNKIVTDQVEELKNNIYKLNAEYEKVLTELEDNEKLIYALQHIKFEDIIEDVKTFKKYVAQTIDTLIINKVDDKILKTIYPNKQDNQLHIQLTTINQTQYNFIISQRSNLMIIPLMDSFYNYDDLDATPFDKTYIKTKVLKEITI